MDPLSACSHVELVRDRSCRITHCDHGTIHLTLGAITVRLKPDQLNALATNLTTAAARLREARDLGPPPHLLC